MEDGIGKRVWSYWLSERVSETVCIFQFSQYFDKQNSSQIKLLDLLFCCACILIKTLRFAAERSMPVMRLILCYYWVYQFIANLKLIIRYEDLIDKGVLLLIHGTAAITTSAPIILLVWLMVIYLWSYKTQLHTGNLSCDTNSCSLVIGIGLSLSYQNFSTYVSILMVKIFI